MDQFKEVKDANPDLLPPRDNPEPAVHYDLKSNERWEDSFAGRGAVPGPTLEPFQIFGFPRALLVTLSSRGAGYE
jgi:hypothetical protein